MRALLVAGLALLGGCAHITDAVQVARGAKIAVAPAVAAAAVAPVNPPPVLTVPVGYDLTLSWAPVSTYQNNAPLKGAPTYKLYGMNNPSLPGFIGYVGNVTSTQRVMSAAGTQCYAISAQVYDPSANEGPKSSTICVAVTAGVAAPSQSSPVCVK